MLEKESNYNEISHGKQRIKQKTYSSSNLIPEYLN